MYYFVRNREHAQDSNNTGTIIWQYSFINTIPSVLYPTGVPVISNVTSTTGQFVVYSNGEVKLIPTTDGNRVVFNVLFN